MTGTCHPRGDCDVRSRCDRDDETTEESTDRKLVAAPRGHRRERCARAPSTPGWEALHRSMRRRSLRHPTPAEPAARTWTRLPPRSSWHPTTWKEPAAPVSRRRRGSRPWAWQLPATASRHGRSLPHRTGRPAAGVGSVGRAAARLRAAGLTRLRAAAADHQQPVYQQPQLSAAAVPEPGYQQPQYRQPGAYPAGYQYPPGYQQPYQQQRFDPAESR